MITEQQYQAAASKSQVPVWILKAMVGQESGGRQGARSPKGASGVAQLMPGTAAYEGRIHKLNTNTPMGNLLGGAYYLREQFDHFKHWDLALAAYNAGPGAVTEHRGIPPYQETQDYVHNILAKAREYRKAYGSVGTGGGVSTGAPEPPITPQGPAFDPKAWAGGEISKIAEGTYNPVDELQSLHQAMLTAAAAQKSSGAMQPAGGQTAPLQVEGHVTKADQKAVSLAQEYLGTAYVWGGANPKGFDCSGLLQYIWGKQGVSIPRTTYDQWNAGSAVKRSQLQPGDAVFFKGSDSRGGLPGHVGIYIGRGKFIESPHTGASVRISKLKGRSDYMGARRFG